MSRRRTPPLRIFEPNIIHNPLTWMGIWTPAGWRIHEKRWGNAERVAITLSGDGASTFFPAALCDPVSGAVEWSDDLHVKNDSFTDGGIYPSDPRVEYPVGNPRWAVSHSLLCFPHADHTLHTHEYVWDLEHGHLQTHFRRHVILEPARTDSIDGRTVAVVHTPISTTIEGNVRYPLLNSAVRGVWDNPRKAGRNLYTQRICKLIPMDNGVYARVPDTPVVQCHGLYATSADDPLDDCFDAATGDCRDFGALVEVLKIPWDVPRLAMLRFPYRQVQSELYCCPISVPAALYGTVSIDHSNQLVAKRAARFTQGRVGFAATNSFDGHRGADGYVPAFDLNDDGVIDDLDAAIVERHIGKEVRFNLYLDGYFGGDWVSTSCCLDVEHRPGTPLIADYEYGGGYDPASGRIHLLDTPGPDQPVWVEYFYDAPADVGDQNIRVFIYRELN